MAGRGRPPKEDRVNKHDVPTRGEMRSHASAGWKGTVPDPPDGMLQASVDAWHTWFGAWFAAFWSPADVPALRQMVRLFDQVEQGEFQRSTELRLLMDTYGVTPKGQQDRRWKPPAEAPADSGPTGSNYGHLRAL